MNKVIRKEIPMGSKNLVLETGKIARQAKSQEKVAWEARKTHPGSIE